MNNSPHMQALVSQIVALCDPLKIIVFSAKVNLQQEVTSFKLCVIAATADKRALEQEIYVTLDCEIPYDVVLYTADEWARYSENEFAFAHTIREKGVTVYDKTPQ